VTTAVERGGRSFAADPIVETPGELPPIWAAQLVSCVVDENVGLPDAAVLTFRDPDHEFLQKTGITIGTPLKVSVVTVSGQARERLFNGEVTALELDRDRTGSFTVVRAYSKAHRLQRGRKVVAYRNMTAAAIVRKVAAGAGLACGTVEAAPVTYKQLSQANVSDWDFLQFLAAESGAQVRVDDKGLLQFTKPAKASAAPAPSTSATRDSMVLEYGRNLLSLRASLSAADGAQQVEVRGWDVTNKRPLVATQPSVNSDAVLPGLSPAFAARFGKSKVTVTDTPYRTQAETKAVADAVASQVSAGFGELEVLAEGNPKLRAGKPVALGNVGQAFSGKYTATAVQHVLEPHGGYRTTVWVSASPDRSLTGLVTGANAPSRGPRMPGLAIGVVTDVREPGGAQSGGVKLKFPWLDDTYVTDWAARAAGEWSAPRSTTRSWSASNRACWTARTSSAGSTTAWTSPRRTTCRSSTRPPARSTAVPSCRVRGTGWSCWTRGRPAARGCGCRPPTSSWRSSSTTGATGSNSPCTPARARPGSPSAPSSSTGRASPSTRDAAM
jgi:phage protein D